MGCTSSKHLKSLPNLFQRNLCVHRKEPVSNAYTVLDTLGRGAFGIVLKVEHVKTKKHYAMKQVTFDHSHKRSEFEKEIDILRGLHHPNVVRMVETFEDASNFYIIMELATAGTLLDSVKARDEPFTEEEVQVIMEKLASVIQYLHSRFICHRDLKLENILIHAKAQEVGDIKLCDFGASTLFRIGVSMRKVLGSVVYMAPEVLEGKYTESCDQWSLGVIMYMLLSNKAPFHGSTDDDLVENILAARVSFEDEIWTRISADAKRLIQKLLDPDPLSRYTAAQVLKNPWIQAAHSPVSSASYSAFIPRLKRFCEYNAFHRAALVAVAFCMPSNKISQHCQLYNELNVAHNGILTLEEMQTSQALVQSELDLQKVFYALDQQQVRGVNLLEFVAATLDIDDVFSDQYIYAAFDLFDRDRKGVVTTQDLLCLLGKHFDRDMSSALIDEADADGDGAINLSDFMKMLKSQRKEEKNIPQRRSSGMSRISSLSTPLARKSIHVMEVSVRA